MGPIHKTAWLLLAMISGCGRGPGSPTKEVEVPNGGPPVLTSTERAEREYQASKRVSGAVAPAMFQQPLEEPQPLKPLTQWTEQEVAADALGRIGAAAVPALVQALQSPDANVRLKAVEVLGRMGAEATDAVPQLIKLLDDPDPAVRKAAARTLGLVGPAAKDAVPALIRALLQPTSP
jgi:HEAT repeat protein